MDPMSNPQVLALLQALQGGGVGQQAQQNMAGMAPMIGQQAGANAGMLDQQGSLGQPGGPLAVPPPMAAPPAPIF